MLNIVRDKGEIKSKGGGIIKVQEVLESGLDTSPVSAVVDLGYISESTFSDKTPLEDVKDETGNVVTSEEGDREVLIQTTLMQTGSGALDIPKEVRNKFYRLYKYNGLSDGDHQEMWFSVGKITPQAELKFTGGRLPFEYKASANASAVTLDGTTVSAFGAYRASSVTIPANEYYEITETTPA